MSINGGAAATNGPSIDVRVAAYDAVSGLARMRFSQDGTTWTDWSAFSGSVKLELVLGDGSRTVYCQVGDAVGNAAAPAQATILLDTTGPVITGMRTLDGRRFTNDPSILIELQAVDAHSGVAQVRLSPDGSIWGPWQSRGQLFAWELSGQDGQKEVFAQARDSLGNAGPPANMSVVLDTTAPAKPSVSSTTHPSSTVWCNSSIAGLRWTAPQDATGIAGYSLIFTRADSVTPYELVGTSSSELSAPVPGQGRWHFKIMALDGAGNWGAVADYVLLIDTAGPAPPALESPSNNEWRLPGPVQLLWKAADDVPSGVKGYQLQLADDASFGSVVFDGVVDATSYQTAALEQGNYFWRVRANDGAGNWGDFGAYGSFTVMRPVPATPQTSAGVLDISNPLMLLVVGVILVAVIAGIAMATMRKKKEPPAEAMPQEAGPVVRWE